MFYFNNDNYMQDLYYYNQNPCYGNSFNPYLNYMNHGMQNQNMMNNSFDTMYMRNNSYGYNMRLSNNLNELYPSTYRIILPVVLKVISNCNYQYVNEDSLNNMVDTVYNIVDGQIIYEDESSKESILNNNSNTNSSVNKSQDTRQNQAQNQSVSKGSNKQDNLLRDIIKIIILKELISKNQYIVNSRPQYLNQNSPYCNSQIYN